MKERTEKAEERGGKGDAYWAGATKSTSKRIYFKGNKIRGGKRGRTSTRGETKRGGRGK